MHTTHDVKILLDTYQKMMQDYTNSWKEGINKEESIKRFNILFFHLQQAYQKLWEGLYNE